MRWHWKGGFEVRINGPQPNEPDAPDRPRREDPIHTLARGAELLILVAAVAVFVVAVFIMFDMDAGSRSQGGRFFVAVGAMVVLGALDTQYGRSVWRRTPFFWTDSPEYARYRWRSLGLMLLAGLVLFGLAFLLP
jgi:hypothetical protein